MTTEFKHIIVEQFANGPGRKTNRFIVKNKYDGDTLGYIQWFTRWRKYCFYPCYQTVFEEDCLKDIASFIQNETAAHKENRKANRNVPG